MHPAFEELLKDIGPFSGLLVHVLHFLFKVLSPRYSARQSHRQKFKGSFTPSDSVAATVMMGKMGMQPTLP